MKKLRLTEVFSPRGHSAKESRAGLKPGLQCRGMQGLKDTQEPLSGEPRGMNAFYRLHISPKNNNIIYCALTVCQALAVPCLIKPSNGSVS